MQHFFVVASSAEGDNLDLLVQAEQIQQVLPVWADHFDQLDGTNVATIYILPPIGPYIKAVDWKAMDKYNIQTRN